jgi:F0F1-type ATP synthase membrane subunit b/b'
VFAGIIVYGFVRCMTPAINKATAAKNAEIRENERRRDEAARAVEEARAEVQRATADAQRIRENIEHDAKREGAIIVATAHNEGQRLIRNAHAEYERARMAARDKLRIELIEHALAEAEKIAAGRIDDRAESTLIGRFVDELENEKR